MKRSLAPGLCAWLAVAFVYGTVHAEHPIHGARQKDSAHHHDHAYQKDGSVYQKGEYDSKSLPPERHLHKKKHWWTPLPPPMAPILESAAVLRVPGPERRVSFRLRQEAGEEDDVAPTPRPEAGTEDDQSNEIQEIKASIARLDQRVNDLYTSMKLLVDKLAE